LLHQKIVYIIDDDPALLRSLKRLLNARGFQAEVFDSTRAFQETADPRKGLCLVLDINLRESSGIDFRRQLVTSGISLPVIFITGNDSEVVRKLALDAGCVAYLRKPFRAHSLIDAIGKAAATPDSRASSFGR
jgi:FixJ family two-component response regulator